MCRMSPAVQGMRGNNVGRYPRQCVLSSRKRGRCTIYLPIPTRHPTVVSFDDLLTEDLFNLPVKQVDLLTEG
jgi:hypothetical protein